MAVLHPAKLALFSRLFCLFIQIVFTKIGSKYDSSSIYQGFLSREIKDQQPNILNELDANGTQLDSFLLKSLDGFGNWDSLFFLYVAEFGYDYEQMMAFFPVFPAVVSFVAKIVHLASFNTIGKLAALYTGSCITNVLAFITAALLLHRLTINITKNKKLANVTVLLFCINPANVFNVAAYTESLYACLQFVGMYILESSASSYRYIMAGFLFAAGAGTRSNGILSAGFLICALTCDMLKLCLVHGKETNLWKIRKNLKLKDFLQLLCISVLGILILISSFVLFQMYGYLMYCTDSKKAILPKDHWCYKAIPVSYSYIQSYYWNVGPFKYYEVKQIPNFVLAFPTIALSYYAVWRHFADKGGLGMLLQYLNLGKPFANRVEAAVGQNPRMFPYACHLLFLITFGIINVHVQVLTRMIFSSTPFIYWFVASLFLCAKDKQFFLSSQTGLLLGFYLSYTLLGLFLHCNFYPWT